MSYYKEKRCMLFHMICNRLLSSKHYSFTTHKTLQVITKKTVITSYYKVITKLLQRRHCWSLWIKHGIQQKVFTILYLDVFSFWTFIESLKLDDVQLTHATALSDKCILFQRNQCWDVAVYCKSVWSVMHNRIVVVWQVLSVDEWGIHFQEILFMTWKKNQKQNLKIRSRDWRGG